MKTKRASHSARFLSVFLIAALCLPSSARALRPLNAGSEIGRMALRPELSPKVKAGLEEGLHAQGNGDLDAGGLEYQRVVKIEEEIPGFLERLEWAKRRKEYEGRVVRRVTDGRYFLVKSQKEVGTASGRSVWSDINSPVREYIAVQLLRALRCNVCDIEIPEARTRGEIASLVKGSLDPDLLYLVQLSSNYSLKDPAIFQKDPLKEHTRKIGAALLLRLWDIHPNNVSPLRDSEEISMMFDAEQAFHPTMEDPKFFMQNLVINYFELRDFIGAEASTVNQSSQQARLIAIDPFELAERIETEELKAVARDVASLRLDLLEEKVTGDLVGRYGPDRREGLVSEIKPIFDRLKKWQGNYLQDARAFFDMSSLGFDYENVRVKIYLGDKKFRERLEQWREQVQQALREVAQELAPAAGAEERKELRWGSWSPISVQVRDFPKADWDTLMESVDRLLRGTTSLEKSLERSELNDTQLYGIPLMMSALKKQSEGNLHLAVERISLALDWAVTLREKLYPDKKNVMDADDLFHELLWKGVPLAGEAASFNGDFLKNLNSLAKFLLKLRDEIPEDRQGNFSSTVTPILSYYAAFPESLRAGTPGEFSEDLKVLETAALSDWNLDRIPPDEFVKTVWRLKRHISAAGAEERYVLRFDKNTSQTLIVKENGPLWAPLVPKVPQGLIFPDSPDWVIPVAEPRLRGLAEFLFQQHHDSIAQGYALQMGDQKVIEAIRAVYPVPGLEQYEGILTQRNFGTLLLYLTNALFIPAGSNIEFFSGGKWAFYEVLEKPWEKIPILGGRSQVWLARKRTILDKGSAEKGHIGGWSWRNLATYDQESSRALVEAKYKDFLRLGEGMGIPPGALRRVQRLYEENPESFQSLFGTELFYREEISHARDFVWASYFFEEAMFAGGASELYIAETVLQPGSFLDRTVWSPAKSSNREGLISISLDLKELSGQSQAVLDTLAVLLEKKGEEWAEAFLWFYLFEKKKEMGYRTGKTSPGHDQMAAGWVLGFLEAEGFSDLHRLEADLWQPPGENKLPVPGSKALKLMQRFHDGNFMTENERIAFLEKSERGEPVSLGLRQPAAGAEEIRFVPAKEKPGVIGFLLGKQGLPFAKLFALAAGQGQRVYFAGVATRRQRDALEEGLPGNAVQLLRERIILSDEIGFDEAADLAQEKLVEQVPLDDHEILQVLWVDYVMQNLLRQINGYLRIAGLGFADFISQERALTLLESA